MISVKTEKLLTIHVAKICVQTLLMLLFLLIVLCADFSPSPAAHRPAPCPVADDY